MPLVRREEDEQRTRRRARTPEPAPDPALLALQRGAGNAAVARMLARTTSVDEMIDSARARETPDEREGVDPSEWDEQAEPTNPVDDMIAKARAREAPDTREGVDPSEWEELTPMEVPEHLANFDVDPQAAPGVWDSRQRARATGQSVEDFQAQPATPQAAPGPAWRFGEARQAKFDRMLGAHAKAAAGTVAADPGQLAAESLQAKRDKEAELQAARDKKVAHRDDALTAGTMAKRRHGDKPDTVAMHIKATDASRDKTHKDMVADDHVEASGYGQLRQRGYDLRNRLAAASPFVSAQVRSHALTVDSIVTAKPTKDLAAPKKRLEEADKAIQTALARENDFKFVREKGTKILADIDGAGPSFKDRISAKSRSSAERYATGEPVDKKEIAKAHSELNEAQQDLDARAKEWNIAQRSRGTLATLKAKRAALGYTDRAADRAIAASDKEDAKDDFWALQESVKQVATEVERLNELERDYQQLNLRITHVVAVHPATVTAGDQATITNGFANRAAAADPQRAYNDLHTLMRSVEAPTIQQDFNALRGAGNFAGATAALQTLVNNGVVRRGAFHSVYSTSYDGEGFSAEFGIEGIPDVVVHTHCTKDGTPKDGTNASHWKPKSMKFDPGYSHPITGALRDTLVDRAEIQARKNFNRQK